MIVFTDGWHPTVNASSRMPIFYLRYKELFGDGKVNVLCETPRTNGGTTFRDVSLIDGGIVINELNKPVKYAPWGINASENNMIVNLFQEIIKKKREDRKPYDVFLAEYNRQKANNLTIGEAVNNTNKIMLNEIYNMPDINLKTISKSPIFDLFVDALDELCKNNLFEILDRYLCYVKKQEIYTFAFLKANRNVYRIEYPRGQNSFIAHVNKEKKTLSKHEFFSLYQSGNIVQSSILTCIIEIVAAYLSKTIIFHFGNVYDNLQNAAKAIGIENKVFVLKENADSWNFAYLRDKYENTYPLHLLDLYADKDTLSKAVNNLISESLHTGKPVFVDWEKGDWKDALLNRGA